MRGKRASLLIIVFLSLSVLLSATQYAHADTGLVPPPTNLTATAVSSSEIDLSWTAATGVGLVVSGYEIERSTNGGLTWSVLVASTGSTATTYSDTGLAHTTTFTYRVHTVTAIGTSFPSDTASATTFAAAPSPPTGLAATAVSSSQIGLTWTAPSDNGGSAITGYKIERSADGGATWSTVVANTGSSATAYSDIGLAHTTAYTYRVSAINSAGTGSPSATASATTLAVAPSPPTGLTATAASSSSQINLSWTAPADNGGSAITGYMIERSTDGGSTWSVLVANTGSTATTYSNVGLSPNTSYTYRMSTINSVGTGSPSTTASATTVAVVPSAPTGLTATAASSSQINLSWTAPNNGGSAITGYKIERSTDGGSTWSTVVPNSGSTATAYSDTGLSAGTSYTYKVSAINAVGVSSPSSNTSATTLAVLPSPPTGLTTTVASSSQINLSWTAPNNGGSPITGYKIDRSADGGSTWATLIANTGSVTTTYS